MELTPLVTAAKLGDPTAFAALVRHHQARLLGSLTRRVGDRQAAEDLAQETFLTAWERMADLRDAEAFPGWLAAIGRSRASAWHRSRNRRPREVGGDAVDALAAPEPPAAGDLARRLAALSPDARRLWDLRHGAGLSLRQIGAVLGVPEGRVKSRLYELRRRLAGPPRSPQVLEEAIMDKIEALRLGAHVVERLALDDQVRLVKAVLSGAEWDDGLLAAVGRVDRGAEYLALYGVRPGFGELIGVLNHVDRFTEHRLVSHLETTDPAAADQVKRNLFVFEDLVLFDAGALGLLWGQVDRDVFATGLTAVERPLREVIAGKLPAADRADLDRRLAAADGNPWVVRAAQEAVVAAVHEWERAGRLQVVRPEGPEGPVTVVALG